MVVHGSNPNIWEMEAEGTGVQIYPQPHSSFEDNLGHM